jgi:predicted  nucleic acid-binding Zn-ribbon protein
MMAVDEQVRDVVETAPGEQRKLRAVLPGLPRLLAIEAESDRQSDRQPVRPDAPGDHFGDALHLVRAASDALERMRARYREIETFSSQQAEYYRGELGAAHAGIRDLQEQNLACEDTIQRLEAQVRAESEQRRILEEALKAMSEAAEALRDQYQHVEARAVSAEAWLARFQGEIATAFGEIPRILGEIKQETEAASQNEQRHVAGGHG